MNDEIEVKQEGFDAIANRLKELYPEPQKEIVYYGTMIPYRLGGDDPLDGVQIWASGHSGPHWHYVTYGFTELYEKESGIPEESGFGFELSFRLKRENGEEQPPIWPVNLLQNLARYVFSTGNVFGPGHHMSCNGPIALETDTQLTALGFRIDPELGSMDTTFGSMNFLQAVAITEDEMNAMMCWDGEKFLGEMEKQIPLCITDLSRGSLMKNKQSAFYTAWEHGMKTDGSSAGFFYIEELTLQEKEGKAWLRLGAGHCEVLRNILKARVGKGRSLYLQSSETAVEVHLGKSQITQEDGVVCLTLSQQLLEELCDSMVSRAGVYPMRSYPLTLELVPTRTTDQDGNVLQVIE